MIATIIIETLRLAGKLYFFHADKISEDDKEAIQKQLKEVGTLVDRGADAWDDFVASQDG